MTYLFRRGQLAPCFDTVRLRGQLSYKQKEGCKNVKLELKEDCKITECALNRPFRQKKLQTC